ncbi:MAG: DMT family transporter [Bacteroidota bacterium]
MKKWGIYIFLALVWGSSFILIKKGLIAFTPYQIAGLRILIAAGVLAPFILGRAKEVKPEAWKYIFLIGIVGNAIPAFLFPLAEQKISSASAGILNVLSPVFTMILGVLFFQLKGKVRQGIGILLGFGGAVGLILAGDGEVDIISQLLYAGFVVLATVGYGLSTNIMKRYLSDTPAVLASGFGLAFVSIPYIFYLFFFAELPQTFAEQPHAWTSLGYIFILGAMGTAIALVLFYRLVQITEPIFSSSVTYVIPIVALALGLMDGETITAGQIGFMLVILAGVYLVNRK